MNPPKAKGPSNTPPITKPIISETPSRAQNLPRNIEGITINKTPIIVEINSNPNIILKTLLFCDFLFCTLQDKISLLMQ